ncbi:MAG: response regulator [Elusimicrobia bacterium]|nr:response regulator [Elusimicrobiota bacterium]
MAPKRRLLLVDDEPMILGVLEGLLAGPAWEIETASNALDALAKARDLRPFFIITDIQMPSYGKGTDMIRALRMEKAIAATPIIVLTGMDPERAQKLMPPDDARARLLTKPPDFARILAIIKEMTGVEKDSAPS